MTTESPPLQLATKDAQSLGNTQTLPLKLVPFIIADETLQFLRILVAEDNSVNRVRSIIQS